MSFSSFSRSVDDIWGHDLERPYWIVLKPGYATPAELDRGNKDSMWLDRSVDSPRIVWDGYCKTALFEIIRECFDPAGTSPFIKVVDAEARRVVRDERDSEIMALRPQRGSGWGPRKTRNHIVELTRWAGMFSGDDETSGIHAEMLVAHGGELNETWDSYERSQAFMKAEMFNENLSTLRDEILRKSREGKIKLHKPCEMGPEPDPLSKRGIADRETPLLSTRCGDLMDHALLDISDFRETGRPDSFYRFGAEKGRRIMEEKQAEAARVNRRPGPDPDAGRRGYRSGLTSNDVPLGDMPGMDKNPF
jgi:hypothetical protein